MSTHDDLKDVLAKDYAAEYEAAGDRIEWLGARLAYERGVLDVQEDIARLTERLSRYEKALREIADWPPDGTLEFAAAFALSALTEEKP